MSNTATPTFIQVLRLQAGEKAAVFNFVIFVLKNLLAISSTQPHYVMSFVLVGKMH